MVAAAKLVFLRAIRPRDGTLECRCQCGGPVRWIQSTSSGSSPVPAQPSAPRGTGPHVPLGKRTASADGSGLSHRRCPPRLGSITDARRRTRGTELIVAAPHRVRPQPGARGRYLAQPVYRTPMAKAGLTAMTLRGISRSVLAAAALMLVSVGVVNAQSPARTEFEIKAAYLFTFGRFVEWPPRPARDDAGFTICVLGTDPFGAALDSTLADGLMHGKKVVAKRIAKPED